MFVLQILFYLYSFHFFLLLACFFFFLSFMFLVNMGWNLNWFKRFWEIVWVLYFRRHLKYVSFALDYSFMDCETLVNGCAFNVCIFSFCFIVIFSMRYLALGLLENIAINCTELEVFSLFLFSIFWFQCQLESWDELI